MTNTLSWNPFIKKIITGKPVKEAKLEVYMPYMRAGTTVFSLTVLVAKKDRELRWLGKSEGDVFTGEHYFLIEPIIENKRDFTQSEKLTGSMVAQLKRWLDMAVKSNFKGAVNNAVKERTEKIPLVPKSRKKVHHHGK